MKRVAIPIANKKLSEFFGKCNHYEIFEIDKQVLRSYELQIPAEIAMLDLPAWLEKRGITDVIAYKVNKHIISLFASRKVNLFIGIPVETPQNLIEEYLQGKLESDKNIIEEITKSTY